MKLHFTFQSTNQEWIVGTQPTETSVGWDDFDNQYNPHMDKLRVELGQDYPIAIHEGMLHLNHHPKLRVAGDGVRFRDTPHRLPILDVIELSGLPVVDFSISLHNGSPHICMESLDELIDIEMSL